MKWPNKREAYGHLNITQKQGTLLCSIYSYVCSLHLGVANILYEQNILKLSGGYMTSSKCVQYISVIEIMNRLNISEI